MPKCRACPCIDPGGQQETSVRPRPAATERLWASWRGRSAPGFGRMARASPSAPPSSRTVPVAWRPGAAAVTPAKHPVSYRRFDRASPHEAQCHLEEAHPAAASVPGACARPGYREWIGRPGARRGDERREIPPRLAAAVRPSAEGAKQTLGSYTNFRIFVAGFFLWEQLPGGIGSIDIFEPPHEWHTATVRLK